MTEFITLRLSTDHVNGRLYQAVRHPGSPGSVVVVSSTRECFEATWEGFRSAGYCPQEDYLEETKEGLKLVIPQTLSTWSQDSLSALLCGDFPPVTFREHFEEIEEFIRRFVWLPNPIDLVLSTLVVLVSFFVAGFSAVPIVETRGPVGSGKSTLQRILSFLCRSGVFASNSTIPAVARIRHLDPCTPPF